jgi:phenylacetic acid degradation operon negative regulatory protein
VKPTAKRIVLELLTAADSHQGSVARLAAAAEILGIDDGATRVALARLVAAGTLELAGRGEYRLGASTRALTEQMTSWRDLEKQVRKWDGGWACVQLGDLPRSDRAALRRRERALRLYGFRELGRGFEIRPDNLAGGIDALRERLRGLGVDDVDAAKRRRGASVDGRAVIFRATELDAATDTRARSLWDADKLTRSYRQLTARIDRFLIAVGDLAPRIAARESFLFGSEVLHAINLDPKLPEPLVDVGARRALVDAMKRLDAVGRSLWAQVFGVPYRLAFVETRNGDNGQVYS